ncbi:hypothetical protein NUU61_006447 [Penicillium alfredii]|uniref:Atos-like conserved domain-containing protein n=1 Tax=Penicillium alfredii TaxID=1506179 RepID=A0A9W9K494_9EURO|nr:uncharacterized protein NUU61_006447 [Penicillium alfredii]KAJ5091577.1 hypothetical protein NUU61_006447 [Penicillium alfredii]
MPLFQDPDRRRHYLWSGDNGQQAQTPGSSQDQSDTSHLGWQSSGITEGLSEPVPPAESNYSKLWTSDRGELIRRIKETSPWRLGCASQDDSDCDVYMPDKPDQSQAQETAQRQTPEEPPQAEQTEELGSPADIQRPRQASPFARLASSPTTPWFGASAFPPPLRKPNLFSDHHEPEPAVETRSRAPSLGSFSSSYVLKAPTSPLVHQANNTDLDFSPRVDSVEASEPFERANRRRTLPPETFRHLQSSPPGLQPVNIRSPLPPWRRDDLFSHHSPRRSLTSAYSLQLASTGQTPASRARRPSFASEISPKSHAPMVGSYEESILRGRMSMNPSKPLDFTAQIGVLGKGKSKGHLKCPPHVTVPFPAVFYSYPTSGSGRSISDDNPSPYVGQIDLENSLPRDDSSTTRRRKRHASPAVPQEGAPADETGATRVPDADRLRRREKRNRRAESPKCPPGGSYRIPQQGQLQIMIKNPHKTAVKLFLVPYDLSDMEPGTKTFIRQRSYSAGPIIDMPLAARKNFGTDRPEASLNFTEDPKDKPILRYLVHLNICCPARGRFYLHSSIRVVFANRVPDGKEKLRNEIQLPEPRYTPYKPTRDSTLTGSTNARLAIEKTSRRRSVGQGVIPLLRPHVSSPSDLPSHWNHQAGSMDVAGSSGQTPTHAKAPSTTNSVRETSDTEATRSNPVRLVPKPVKVSSPRGSEVSMSRNTSPSKGN